MLQNSATKSLLAVPGYPNLLQRGVTFYFRKVVPEELRPALKKREILKSLRTSDKREAVRLLAFEYADANAQFAEARRKLKHVSTPTRKIPSLSEAEIHRLVTEWFVGEERQSLAWWESTGQFLNPPNADDAVLNFEDDLLALHGGDGAFEPDDGTHYLDAFLAERGLECPKETPEYRKLRNVFRLGRLETLYRLKDLVEESPS